MIEAATNEVLAVREEMKHSRDEGANKVAEAVKGMKEEHEKNLGR